MTTAEKSIAPPRNSPLISEIAYELASGSFVTRHPPRPCDPAVLDRDPPALPGRLLAGEPHLGDELLADLTPQDSFEGVAQTLRAARDYQKVITVGVPEAA